MLMPYGRFLGMLLSFAIPIATREHGHGKWEWLVPTSLHLMGLIMINLHEEFITDHHYTTRHEDHDIILSYEHGAKIIISYEHVIYRTSISTRIRKTDPTKDDPSIFLTQ